MGELLIEELLKEDSLCGLLNPSMTFGHSLSHVPIPASLKEGGGSNVRYVSAAALLPLRYRYFASVVQFFNEGASKEARKHDKHTK